MNRRIPRIAALALLPLLAGVAHAQGVADPLESWLDRLDHLVPRQAEQFSTGRNAEIRQAARAIEEWAAELGTLRGAARPEQLLAFTRRLLAAKTRVDHLLEETLDVRRQFSALAPNAERHDALRGYLRTMSQLIDLAGRLRYVQVDALRFAVPRLASSRASFDRLLDLLIAERSSAGAMMIAQRLPRLAEGGQAATSAALARKSLELIATTGATPLLADLAELLRGGKLPDELAIEVAETIRRIGLPQQPRPDPVEPLPDPAPAIMAAELYELLDRIEPSGLAPGLARRHADLLAWLLVRKTEGVTEPRYRLGAFDVEPGDWLLMRNPSPYNQFTDLAPGLFTHVGVVTLEQGPDGISRMVVVDLPERGTRMPATNVETYIQRTLHYVFLRHPDPATARSMAAAAREMIGNETCFDLNFRTDRVRELAGRPLAGEKIHTYCAGLLLLCAQQTGLPREEFFPIPEAPAGGHTVDNMARLGLSIGQDFISPTGALFCPNLGVAGRQEPMYDPRREIEEAIFDHFAERLASDPLVPSPDLFQSLRLKLAEAARQNPLLAQAMAKAAGVDSELDLVSAAKAAAVVETLDEIAFGSSREFLEAREVLLAVPLESLERDGLSADELALAREYHRRHAELYRRLHRERMTPRELRQELVDYYIAAGEKEIDRRFFTPPR